MLLKFIKNNKGFTLIELLTVIAIIGLLATLSMASMSVARERADISNAQHDLDQIYKAITLLQNDTEQWPGHQVLGQSCIHLTGGCPLNNEICETCVRGSLGSDYAGLLADHTTVYPHWSGPYMRDYMVNDPWNNEYFLDTDYELNIEGDPCCDGVCVKTVAVIGSYGPDGLGESNLITPDSGGCDDIILILAQ